MHHSNLNNKGKNPWKTLNGKLVYQNPWIAVYHDEVLTPNQTNGIYGTVHFKNLAIGILPIDSDGNTCLIGQYRYPLNAWSWEIPEGGGALNLDPLDSAIRELKEETGWEAQCWQPWFEMDLSNSVSDEKAIIFLASEITKGKAFPEESELLHQKVIPINEAINMVMSGEIRDSISVAALLRYQIDFL